MKRMVTAIATLSGALMGIQAQAAHVVLNSGTPYDYMVHANSAGDGFSLNLITKPEDYYVNVSSSDHIDVGNGNGVAQVNGFPKGQDFSDVTIGPITPIDPLDPTAGFSVIQFKIEGPTGRVKGDNFDIFLTFLNGDTQNIFDQALPANDKIDIFADGDEIIASVKLYGLVDAKGNPLDFNALKQISFNAASASAVPEPASWAMMVGGFGLVGSSLRRRKKHVTSLA
jgi:PEP-CTERM putative exosortase interaction domain